MQQTLTEAGYVGEDVENVIILESSLRVVDFDVKKAETRHYLLRRN